MSKLNTKLIANLSATNIKKELDKYIVGQEKAKKILSIAVASHYLNKELGNKSIKKPNILLQGPTGTGKTYMIETLSKILDVPLLIVDATMFTEAGYQGKDATDMITMLINKVNEDIKEAERGIIYIDEIDKLAERHNPGEGESVSRIGVQQSLLKILEGAEIETGINSDIFGFNDIKDEENYSFIDTSNILFIAGGAFSGLRDGFMESKYSIGFNKEENKEHKKTKEISNKMLIEYGFIPEFLGRFPIIVSIESLSKDELIRIMTEPEGAILRQYRHLFSVHNIELSFSTDILEYVSEEAISRGTGARGIRNVLEEIIYLELYDAIDMGKSSVRITKEALTKQK